MELFHMPIITALSQQLRAFNLGQMHPVQVDCYLGSVSPTVVNFNRRFSPHFNLQLAYVRFTNAS